MTARDAAFDQVAAWVQRALDDEEGNPPRPRAVDPTADDATVLRTVVRHRVGDLLLGRADPLGLPGAVVDRLRAVQAVERDRLRLQVMETARLAGLLADAGIDALFFKGLALAARTTGDVTARGPGDIDVLVAPARAADAHRLLVGAGWRHYDGYAVEPGTWAWDYVHRWGRALTYRGPGADADLHWRLEAVAVHPPFEDLWARRQAVLVGGVELATLSDEVALRHSAAHGEGWIWLRTLVDLRRLARDPAVLAGPLPSKAVASLAVARETVGLPASVPARVHAQLDRVPVAFLARVRETHLQAVRRDVGGGPGTVRAFRHQLALSRTAADYRQAAVTLLLPPHAVMGSTSPDARRGIPRALWQRGRDFRRHRSATGPDAAVPRPG